MAEQGGRVQSTVVIHDILCADYVYLYKHPLPCSCLVRSSTIVSELALELLHQVDILLLSVFLRGACIHNLLPCLALGFALTLRIRVSILFLHSVVLLNKAQSMM